MDPLAFTALNREFHTAIVEYCPNRHLKERVMQEWDRMDALRRSLFIYSPSRAAASVGEHEQILKLIRTGAPAAEIEQVAREHKLRISPRVDPPDESASPPEALPVKSTTKD
jgi:DNA-binding GntR family transcriptional regulator